MFDILSKPFPAISSLRHRLFSSTVFGVFVFLFLWIFQPFGLSTVNGPIWPLAMGYGVITLSCMLFVQVGAVSFLPAFYVEDRWNIGREFAHTILIVMLVALGNFFLSVYLGFFDFSLNAFLLFIGFTIAVGIFPVLAQILVRQNIHQKENLIKSEQLTKSIPIAEKPSDRELLIELKDQEGRTELHLEISTILAMESADNYVEVYYLSGGAVQKSLIRNTLKHFEQQLAEQGHFFRCHRSFLVNLRKVKKVRGNARGLSLFLHPALKEIPVARRQLDAFSQMMGAPGR